MDKKRFTGYFLTFVFIILSIVIIYNLLSNMRQQKNDREPTIPTPIQTVNSPPATQQTGTEIEVQPLPKEETPIEAKPGVKLSQNQIIQIESRMRDVFKHQRASVNSSLIYIGGDLDQFLFGPATTGRLLKFFDQRIRKSEIKDSEEMWKLFKQEVLTKEAFDRVIDELIEVHFRSYTKARKEANRELMMYGLDGISAVNYEDIKTQIKFEVNKLWNLEEGKMREIISKTKKDADDANIHKTIDASIYVTATIVEAIALKLPPYNLIAGAAIAAIVTAWVIYEYCIAKGEAETKMFTAQQKYMKDMEERLHILSNNTKGQFRLASDIATDRLFEAIRHEITQAYPQLRKENLR